MQILGPYSWTTVSYGIQESGVERGYWLYCERKTVLGHQNKKKSRFEFSIHHLPAVCAWKPKPEPYNLSAS